MKDHIVRARSSIVISGVLLSVGFCCGGGGFFCCCFVYILFKLLYICSVICCSVAHPVQFAIKGICIGYNKQDL